MRIDAEGFCNTLNPISGNVTVVIGKGDDLSPALRDPEVSPSG
jgi:hypothetical protein